MSKVSLPVASSGFVLSKLRGSSLKLTRHNSRILRSLRGLPAPGLPILDCVSLLVYSGKVVVSFPPSAARGRNQNENLRDFRALEISTRRPQRPQSVSVNSVNSVLSLFREEGMERKNRLPPVHPGEIIREDALPEMGLSVTAAAKALGVSRQMLHDILAERKPLSAVMCLKISRLLGSTPEFWMRLQAGSHSMLFMLWAFVAPGHRQAHGTKTVPRLPPRRVSARSHKELRTIHAPRRQGHVTLHAVEHQRPPHRRERWHR